MTNESLFPHPSLNELNEKLEARCSVRDIKLIQVGEEVDYGDGIHEDVTSWWLRFQIENTSVYVIVHYLTGRDLTSQTDIHNLAKVESSILNLCEK
jgi:hypothetical protein